MTSVKKGKFNVWAVGKIDDGIRILTGVSAGQLHKDGTFTKDSVFDKAQKRIAEFSKITKKFGKSLDKEIQQEFKDNNKEDEEEE